MSGSGDGKQAITRRVSMGSFGHDPVGEVVHQQRKHSLPFLHDSEPKSESSEETSTKKGERPALSPGTVSDSRSFEFLEDLDSEDGTTQGLGVHSSDPSTAVEPSTVVERHPAASSSSSQPESLESPGKELRKLVLLQSENTPRLAEAVPINEVIEETAVLIPEEESDRNDGPEKGEEMSSEGAFVYVMRGDSEHENESEEEKKESTTSEECDPLPPLDQKVDDLTAFASSVFSRRTLSGELSTVSEVSEEISAAKSSTDSEENSTGSLSPHEDHEADDGTGAADVREDVDKEGTLKAKKSAVKELLSKSGSATESSHEQESSSSSNKGRAEGGREGEDSTSASIPGDDKKALSTSSSISLSGSKDASIDPKTTATTTAATVTTTKDSVSFRKQDISGAELESDPKKGQQEAEPAADDQKEGAGEDEPEAEVLESHEMHDMESSQATERDFAKSEFSLEQQSSQEIDDDSLSGLGVHASGGQVTAPTPQYHLLKAVSLDETSSSIIRRGGKCKPPVPSKSSLILELESRRGAGARRPDFLRSRSQDITSPAAAHSSIPPSTASADPVPSYPYQPLPSCPSSLSTMAGLPSAVTETSRVSSVSDTQVPEQESVASSSQSQSSPELKHPPFAKSVTIDIVYRSSTGMRVPSEDEDAGCCEESYAAHSWIYIPKKAEFDVWVQRLSNASAHNQEEDDELTDAEKVFRKQFSSLTHRMIHRKATLEMFRRIITNNFRKSSHPPADEG